MTPVAGTAGVYPRADVKVLECVPDEGNGLVEIRMDPLPEGLRPEDVDARVYFRRGADDALFVSTGSSNWSAVSTQPSPRLERSGSLR